MQPTEMMVSKANSLELENMQSRGGEWRRDYRKSRVDERIIDEGDKSV